MECDGDSEGVGGGGEVERVQNEQGTGVGREREGGRLDDAKHM